MPTYQTSDPERIGLSGDLYGRLVGDALDSALTQVDRSLPGLDGYRDREGALPELRIYRLTVTVPAGTRWASPRVGAVRIHRKRDVIRTQHHVQIPGRERQSVDAEVAGQPRVRNSSRPQRR